MKKIVSLIALVVAITMMTSCKTNMRRDAKLLAHKTEQCFSLIDLNNITSEDKQKFDECYTEMEVMMEKFDKRYKSDAKSQEFSKIFIEEIQKSDLDSEIKQIFSEIYALNDKLE